MAAVQASSLLLPLNSQRRIIVGASTNAPRVKIRPLSFPKFPSTRDLSDELFKRSQYKIPTTTVHNLDNRSLVSGINGSPLDPVLISKLCAVLEAVADRIEMHENVGVQRDNWNHLMLTSINGMTLTASTMAALAAAAAGGDSSSLALKIASVSLYLGATFLLMIVNKIQPSQLGEEQRNAARLFKQLHRQIESRLKLGVVSLDDVSEAMENVLALDKAYPLPLLGSMLEKFPSVVEPATWWPLRKHERGNETKIGNVNRKTGNGWNRKLEEEMRGIVGTLRRKDMDEYLRLSKKALKLNKMLAISGPLLTTLAALGSGFVGTSQGGSWAAMVAIVAGVLSTLVNTIEHGGQVGMVFEMYRNNAGYFKLMEEILEANINEEDVSRRENGDVLELKVALQLGRSLSELKQLATSSSSSTNGDDRSHAEEFASKIF
ncbi:probable F-box protein At4g22030 [Carica papaya]|uniref:probable F-box protein At4g22030 n=1 Tax=Carica papaya TaxID=3649 RepID=UPI000B8CB97C|nr:probable F-box protein At4g22030 [Carica papaya]